MDIIEIIPPENIIVEVVNNPIAVKGDKGDDGKSAYQSAVENGFVGTEEEWNNSYIDRANHIGTQDIDTINNLQTTLDDLDIRIDTKEDADPTILKEADIGVTVQAYSPHTIVDGNYIPFTQSEKDKLAGIQIGAEVNVQSDWNSTSGDSLILNKPTLGTIASRDSSEFATASQGDKADSALQPSSIANFETSTQLNNRDTANRNRDNHTGTQAISTVDGLQTVLDSKEPNITSGTTSQYWRGDKSWQTLDKNAVGLGNVSNLSDLDKPVSIATQTALNLKANLASPTFTGQLNLPNNTRINGVEHFYQNTKPITRGDSSALVVGDRWCKTNDGTEWYWNGTYWLSPPRSETGLTASISGTSFFGSNILLGKPTYTNNQEYATDLFIHQAGIFANVNGADASNFWTITLSASSNNSVNNIATTIINFFTFNRFILMLSNTTINRSNQTIGISGVRTGTTDVLQIRTHVIYSQIFI